MRNLWTQCRDIIHMQEEEGLALVTPPALSKSGRNKACQTLFEEFQVNRLLPIHPASATIYTVDDSRKLWYLSITLLFSFFSRFPFLLVFLLFLIPFFFLLCLFFLISFYSFVILISFFFLSFYLSVIIKFLLVLLLVFFLFLFLFFSCLGVLCYTVGTSRLGQ